MMEEEHLDRLAERLLNRAIDVDVAFPKRYNTRDKKLYVCYKRIIGNMKKRGGVDEEGALEDLISRYGTTTQTSQTVGDTSAHDESEYYSSSASVASGGESPGGKTRVARKGPKKSEMIANDKNRPLIKMLTDMADEYFKLDDSKRAIHYKAVIKQVRRCKEEIKSGAMATHLPGVGARISDHIQEFLETGHVTKLDEMKQGLI